MTKQETIDRACQIVGMAYRSLADFEQPSDCFCSEAVSGGSYQNSGRMLDYIEQAVREKLTRDGFTIKD